jgi:hypothetical protein
VTDLLTAARLQDEAGSDDLADALAWLDDAVRACEEDMMTPMRAPFPIAPCARCGAEVPNPRRGTFGDVLCDGCISGLNDALDAVQDEQWGPDSAQQALERGPR